MPRLLKDSRKSHRTNTRPQTRWPRRLKRSAALTSAYLLWAALPASAATSVLASPADPSINDLATVVGRATTWIVKISAVVATFYLTLGGARYMTGGSDPAEVEKAKGALKAAGIGYALCILSPVILLILKSILGVS